LPHLFPRNSYFGIIDCGLNDPTFGVNAPISEWDISSLIKLDIVTPFISTGKRMFLIPMLYGTNPA
jgi:hypothetical protein